jgi:DNA helicase-2/ATP-dependent DNA helicase PcrA
LHRLNPSQDRLVLDDHRRAAIKGYSDVQACPGSGKTTLVAFKLLLLAKTWHERHSGMCVLTHTNVAKDEILKCLRRHPAGHRLLSYPHFVGTIQEFVNTFLALPYARARGWDVNVVDGETYDRAVAKRNWGKAKDRTTGNSYWFTRYFLSKKIRPVDFVLTHELGKFAISADFLNAVNKHIDPTDVRFSSANLLRKRERLCESGIFQYREMYALAEQALCDNGQLSETLRHRFPIVILDEMQDAQKFQDELINRIFKHPG